MRLLKYFCAKNLRFRKLAQKSNSERLLCKVKCSNSGWSQHHKSNSANCLATTSNYQIWKKIWICFWTGSIFERNKGIFASFLFLVVTILVQFLKVGKLRKPAIILNILGLGCVSCFSGQWMHVCFWEKLRNDDFAAKLLGQLEKSHPLLFPCGKTHLGFLVKSWYLELAWKDEASEKHQLSPQKTHVCQTRSRGHWRIPSQWNEVHTEMCIFRRNLTCFSIFHLRWC